MDGCPGPVEESEKSPTLSARPAVAVAVLVVGPSSNRSRSSPDPGQRHLTTSIGIAMSSLDDHSAPTLKPGDWFTTNDEFLDQPSFLRDPEETCHRFQEQQQRPPHGMPMQVIVVHEYSIYLRLDHGLERSALVPGDRGCPAAPCHATSCVGRGSDHQASPRQTAHSPTSRPAARTAVSRQPGDARSSSPAG